MSRQIVVIGGGAAGMMAAITAAEAGARVTVVERNERPGRKLMITGKGRCNVTNACGREEFLSHVTSDPRFLYSALSAFPTERTVAFFEESGVPLKTERGKRVFPVSDRAVDVVDALHRRMERAGARLVHDRVTEICLSEGRVVSVKGEREQYPCDACILCTGGLSYPLTGSTGDGYDFARALGHTVTPLRASLSAVTSPDPLCGACMGLSLRNAGIRLERDGREIYTDFGEMLFTHFGLSGPVILSASTQMDKPGNYELHVDLKPALSPEQVDARLLREIGENPRKEFRSLLHALLPASLCEPFLGRTGIPGEKRCAEVSRAERERTGRLLKDLCIPLSGLRPVEEAIITAGGVSTREVDPKTMASKKAAGLFFAGEVLDVSAETGGFNLQIAFATGCAAGRAAAGE